MTIESSPDAEDDRTSVNDHSAAAIDKARLEETDEKENVEELAEEIEEQGTAHIPLGT